MKNKLIFIFLLGIGTGLVLASIINILGIQEGSNVITETYIRQEARRLGMIDPKEYFNKSLSADNATKGSTDAQTLTKSRQNKIIVNIEKGWTHEAVAKKLKENKLILAEDDFLDLINLSGASGQLKWGSYEFNSNITEEEMIYRMVNGIYKSNE